MFLWSQRRKAYEAKLLYLILRRRAGRRRRVPKDQYVPMVWRATVSSKIWISIGRRREFRIKHPFASKLEKYNRICHVGHVSGGKELAREMNIYYSYRFLCEGKLYKRYTCTVAPEIKTITPFCDRDGTFFFNYLWHPREYDVLAAFCHSDFLSNTDSDTLSLVIPL